MSKFTSLYLLRIMILSSFGGENNYSEILQMRNGGEMSISASNTIVSLYCSCFPLGACIGSFAAGELLNKTYVIATRKIIGFL